MAADTFGERMAQLLGGRVAEPDLPLVLGGHFQATDEQITRFLELWRPSASVRPWRMVFWTSDAVFEHGQTQLPPDIRWLERLREFGPGGDLTMRRDEERVRWHFVGPNGADIPVGRDGGGAADGFLAIPWTFPTDGADVIRREREVLLWGEEVQDAAGNGLGEWAEDRVAGGVARLRYDGMADGTSSQRRVQLHYSEYSAAGNLVAVWYRGLAWAPPPKEGKAKEARA